MQKSKIPIFFTVNEDYAPLAAIAISSLIQNASKSYKYEIYVIHDGLSKETCARMRRLATDYARIHLRSMRRSFAIIPKTYLLNMSRFTSTIYFRLFLPAMFPEYDKAIYLDADTVVLGDISKLYHTDLKGNLLGAVADPTIYEVKTFAEYAEEVLGVSRYEYVNSGVLLMDMKGLRQARFGSKCLRLLKKYGFGTIAPDQDYINSVLKGYIFLLGFEWNVMPAQGPQAMVKATSKKKPQIVHYNLFNKPWHYSGVQYENFFWDYSEKSEFLDAIKDESENYTTADRVADKESLDAMLVRATEIKDSKDIKFKDVPVELKKKSLYDYWRK